LNETIDNKDVISLNEFWIIKDSVKNIIYKDIDNLIFYKDSNNYIRCFEKESLEYMLGYNIINHPVTGELFPSIIFSNIISKKMILEEEKSISELTLDVYQLFSNNSFFMDHKLFLNLSKNNLIELYFEFSNLYNSNFSYDQRCDISISIFLLTCDTLSTMPIDEIQKYIIINIKILLENSNKKYKYMINYVLIGGLSLYIEEVGILYPSFSF
jgi:hypothetical protein